MNFTLVCCLLKLDELFLIFMSLLVETLLTLTPLPTYHSFSPTLSLFQIGNVIVTESSGNSLSKPDTVSGVYRVTEGGAVDLPCLARGQPLPSYTWFKVNPVTGAQEPLSASPSLFPRHSVLSIVGASAGDSGRYICRVHNKVSLNIGSPHLKSFRP